MRAILNQLQDGSSTKGENKEGGRHERKKRKNEGKVNEGMRGCFDCVVSWDKAFSL